MDNLKKYYEKVIENLNKVNEKQTGELRLGDT